MKDQDAGEGVGAAVGGFYALPMLHIPDQARGSLSRGNLQETVRRSEAEPEKVL